MIEGMPLPWECLTAFNEVLAAEQSLALAEDLGVRAAIDEDGVERAKAAYDALKDPS